MRFHARCYRSRPRSPTTSNIPRVDEETIGFERALTGTMRLSLTGVWRDNKNFVNSVCRPRSGQPMNTTTDVGNTDTLYNGPIERRRMRNT